MKKIRTITFVLISIALLFAACKKDPDQVVDEMGYVKFTFDHRVDGNLIKWDTMCYTNAAGNEYSVYEIQYFISRVQFHKKGVVKEIAGFYHYIDNQIPQTLSWIPEEKIAVGDYDSISFTFGFNQVDNNTINFVNAPEAFMFWPTDLGGGYHYMKMNGKWKDTNNVSVGFGVHLGTGQLYHGNSTETDSIYAFVDNSFKVCIPASSFTIKNGITTTINMHMNIEEWFKNPINYNHNQYGGGIMQNQEAMGKISQNGKDVFSVSF